MKRSARERLTTHGVGNPCVGGAWEAVRRCGRAGIGLAVVGAVCTVLCSDLWGVGDGDNVSGPADERDAVRQALERATRVSVLVLVDGHMAGSGVFVDRQGLVLTAAHVISGKRTGVRVVDGAGQEFIAEVLAVDDGHDVAILAANGARPASWLKLADRAPRLGERIFLVGSPLYRHGTVTPGWVARNETTFEYVDERYIEVLPVAGLSARGASGGAWVNERGEVVGVQSSMMSLREIPQGLLFAAPLHAVRDLLHSRTDAVAADMGLAVEELWEKPPEVIREYPASTRGLYVAAVVEDGPAAQAGLAVGSVITAVEGRPVRFRDQLLRLMRTRPPGGTLRLTVITREAAGPRQVTVRLVPLKEVQQRTREGGKK